MPGSVSANLINAWTALDPLQTTNCIEYTRYITDDWYEASTGYNRYQTCNKAQEYYYADLPDLQVASFLVVSAWRDSVQGTDGLGKDPQLRFHFTHYHPLSDLNYAIETAQTLDLGTE